MNIRITSDEKRSVTVHITGLLGINESQKLMSELLDADLDAAAGLTLDLSELRYITSSGLRALLILQKRMEGKLFRVTGMNDDVRQVFRMTGFDTFLN